MFDRETVKLFMKNTGMNIPKLAKAIDVSPTSLTNYLLRGTNPTIEVLEKLADYYAVSVDFLLGRCSHGENEDFIENYPKFFMELRKSPYETYLIGRRPLMTITKREYEAPYPYNLLDDIKESVVSWVVTEQNEKTLDLMLNTLSERHREVVTMYYKDGMSLDAIGKRLGFTREHIRQLIQKGLNELRSLSKRKGFAAGLRFQSNDKLSADVAPESLEAAKKDLEKREIELSHKEEEFEKFMDSVLSGLKISEDNIPDFIKYSSKFYFSDEELNKTPIMYMNLSMRTRRCFLKEGINTAGEIIELLEKYNAGMIKIRNMGTKTYFEVVQSLDKLYCTTRYSDKFLKSKEK